jgi:hypothetical protein
VLSYRRGYFAVKDPPATADATQGLNAALQPQTPEATMLGLQANVHVGGPPQQDSQKQTVPIDSVIDPAGVGFADDATGRKRAQLLVTVVAYDKVTLNQRESNDRQRKKGGSRPAPPAQSLGVLNIALEPDAYASIVRTGIPVHQQLALPSGRYFLRLGVSDNTSHRLGTLDMPIEVTAARP